MDQTQDITLTSLGRSGVEDGASEGVVSAAKVGSFQDTDLHRLTPSNAQVKEWPGTARWGPQHSRERLAQSHGNLLHALHEFVRRWIESSTGQLLAQSTCGSETMRRLSR